MPATSGEEARSGGIVSPPIALLIGTVCLLPLALLTVKTVPIGSMYWDLLLYFDAANRIFDGQTPGVDFFAPVGPLGYWLFSGALAVFPHAQPLLLVEWSLFVVSAPLMALLLIDVGASRRPVAWGLLLPFLYFSILPFNVREYFVFAGSDGFGIYNRQGAVLLYLMVASLLFVRSQWILCLLVAFGMLALFLTKITTVAVAVPLCLLALATGRLSLKVSLISAAVFLAALAVLETLTGVVSAYVNDVLTLLSLNSGNMLFPLLSSIMRNFKTLLPVGMLVVLLVWLDRRSWAERFRALTSRPGPSALAEMLDQHAVWLVVVCVTGVFYESQNYGSQDLVFLWPVLLAVIVDARLPHVAAGWRVAVTVVAFIAIAPVAMIIAERAGRASTGALAGSPLEHENLKTVGAVGVRPFRLELAQKFANIYPSHRPAYEAMAAADMLPSYALFFEFKYQIGYLMHIDEAITAIKALETDKNIRFDTLFHISFTNPFPWLMDRSAPRHVAIGADPYRAVPPPDEEVNAAVSEVDLALFPTCPLISNNVTLLKIYEQALARHQRIQLTPCYDAFVHPDIAGRMELEAGGH